MNVIIWDLDYYYAEKKVNCFNPDAMKISSYHKQLGDQVYLVQNEFDYRRPFDLCYIIKNDIKKPHPPKEFFLNPKVKWWGKAYKARIKWRMNDAMLGARPDYLLYPEKNTRLERSEQVRLFNDNAELLPLYQDWTNTFKNKFTIVTDPYMWYSDSKSLIKALKILQQSKKVSFFEPIWLQKLICNKEVREEFLKLHFSPGSKVTWQVIKIEYIEETLSFIKEFKKHFPSVGCGEIVVDWRKQVKEHWASRETAIEDFNTLKRLIVRCKKEGIMMVVKMPAHRLETPYFEVFEELGHWTKEEFTHSWLEYLSKKYGCKVGEDAQFYWNHPAEWHDLFRDLLRQTWIDEEFILLKWKNTQVSKNLIPWNLWKEEFKYGI